MMEDKFISLKLAKKLHAAGCRIESDFWWCQKSIKKGQKEEFYIKEINKTKLFKDVPMFPTYSYYDLIVTHLDKFFEEDPSTVRPFFEEPPIIILRLLQQGKREEVELYFIKNCLYFKK